MIDQTEPDAAAINRSGVVRQVLAAIKRRDVKTQTLLLHPYLHWTCSPGVVIRGRKNVLAHLAATPVERLPRRFELRDGQIYRWFE